MNYCFFTEALGHLMTHFKDIHTLLLKRHITKEILYQYLYTRLPTISTDFTKADLVMNVIQYWDQQETSPTIDTIDTTVTTQEQKIITTVATTVPIPNVEEYPIHLMARTFGEWFFKKFNENTLNSTDLWTDTHLELRVIANDGVSNMEHESASEVVNSLLETKNQFGIYFNPNLSHSGAQGRMDVYGQVVVLCCGTLHTKDACVGVFECAFGLLRDPHACNNWKPKNLKWLLRSEVAPPPLHTLEISETLQEALALPAPSDTLD